MTRRTAGALAGALGASTEGMEGNAVLIADGTRYEVGKRELDIATLEKAWSGPGGH